MDGIIANIVRLRACQAAILAFFAAVAVINVDVKSLVVINEPIVTMRYPPHVQFTGHAVAHVTSPPALMPSIWPTDPIKAPKYATKTVPRDSPSLKSIILNLPTTETPCPRAPANRPQTPFKAISTVPSPFSATSTPYPYRKSTTGGDHDDGFDTRNQPFPEQHWILDSIRGVFRELKQRVLIMAAENLHFIELGLASFTMAKDRKIYRLEYQIGEWEKMTSKAVDLAEAAGATAQKNKLRAATRIAQLQSIIEERKQALTKQQWACKKKLEEAAEDTARSLKDMDSKLETEKEKASKALQKAKDDGTREARHLTDLAIEQHAEAAERRKADKATIDALQNQSAADTNKIRDLSHQVNSIAQEDEKVASLETRLQSLTKNIKDLTQERDRALKYGVDAEAATRATIANLSERLELANKRCQAAEAKASYQKALVAQAREEQGLAEERAERLEAKAAKVKARKQAAQAAEEEASREKARMEAKKAQEAWQAQKELKKLYQQDPTCSEVPTPRSDLSSQDSSMLPHPQPAVRLPMYVAGQKDVCSAQSQSVSWCDRPAKTIGKTPPEERGLPANTPTGPKAERWGGRI